jgi:phosphoadenosine phosphosulfate reductase
VPLNNAIESLELKALITGVRWDEQEARSGEEYFSERQTPPHVRVQPILHFTEKDIWRYIKEHQVPYCGLYENGYRSLGCATCTAPSDGIGPERQGRSMDKEHIMKTLRDLGYF